MENQKEKKQSRAPHLLAFVIGLLLLASLLTYIVPAGQFSVGENGMIDGSSFAFLDKQTPVNPWEALMAIATGFINSANIIVIILALGGVTVVFLSTKRLDNLLDVSIARLQGKGIDVLVPLLTLAFIIYGFLCGGDWAITLVPIGCMIARKLKCDPVLGASFILISVICSSVFGPMTGAFYGQLLMGVPLYSGFGTRILLLIPIWLFTMFYLWRYAKRVAKDPTKSALGNTDWLNTNYDNVEIKDTKASSKDFLVTILFVAQTIGSAVLIAIFRKDMTIIVPLSIIFALLIGLVHGYRINQICEIFAKGIQSVAFIGFIIGAAGGINVVLSKGNIIHTIIHYAVLPPQNVKTGFALIGIAFIITLINIIIPSMTAKAAVICPLLGPMCDALGIHRQAGIVAFTVGDGVTNMISPALGMLIGGLEIAGVPYRKWLKFIMPYILILLAYGYIVLFILAQIGWTGGV